MAELGTDLRSIKRNWWVVVVAAVLGGLLGFGVALLLPKEYRSSVEFFVSTPSGLSANLLEANQFASERASTYVNLLSSDQLANRVLTATKADLTVTKLQATISAKNPANTVLVDVDVTDTSAARSLAVATSISTEFPAMVRSLESVQASNNTVRLVVTNGPTLANGPVSPVKSLDAGIGVLLGLAIGLIIAIVRGRRDRSLRSPAAVQDTVPDVPLIGAVTMDKAMSRRPSAALSVTPSVRRESIRRVRASLDLQGFAPSGRVLLITSPGSGDGRTTTAISLAASIAETGRKVVLVDADLRAPALGTVLQLTKTDGLTDVLTGRLSLAAAVQGSTALGVTLLPSGPRSAHPAELLGSAAMADLLGHLRREFDVVVLDASPVLPVADTLAVAPLVDGVIVLVRRSSTTGEELASAVDALRGVGAPVLGVVLNMAAATGPDAPLGVSQAGRLLPDGAPVEGGRPGGVIVPARPTTSGPVAGSTLAPSAGRAVEQD